MPHPPFFRRLAAPSLALCALLATPPLPAQQTSSVHPEPPPVGRAARRETQVTIDGRLDEGAWSMATPITGLRQFQPTEGAPASLPTEVRILFDDEALYVGALMRDSQGVAGIRAPLARRDQLLAANGNNGSFNSLTTDKLAIVLDPYHNHLDEAWFEVNPMGVRGDQFNGDPSWDPIWEASAQIGGDGWTAEMRIPYSQLRFSRDREQTWGLQIVRHADRLAEQDVWSFRRRNESGGPAYYGHLEGITIGDRPRQLELLPYVVSRGQFKAPQPGDPYHSKRDYGASAGADLKYLLTSNLTLDATFNPDFGQVEVDPASLNLSAYETFYDEKRPFFVAGRSAFGFGGMSCMFCSNVSGLGVFYSRRIGRPPQLNDYVNSRLGEGGFADAPDDAAILGAAKITGRTNSGYTIGVLDAVANRATSRYITATGAPELRQEVEPLSNYFVGRVRKEFRQGATTVGTIVTSTIRRLDDSISVHRLRSRATAVGLDWSHAWNNRVYRWRGSVVASDIRGSAPAIALVQRSSAHYFQRPDREVTRDELFSARHDTTATQLRGYGLYTRLAKESGSWLWEAAQNWRSPGFEVNDLAYLDRADYRWMNLNLARQWTKPGKLYRSIFTSIGGQQQFNYDGIRNDLQYQWFGGMELPNYWNVRTFAIHRATTEDDRLTRGGPVVKREGNNLVHVQVSTDPRQRAVFDVAFQGARTLEEGARTLLFGPGLALKPASSIFVQLSPTYYMAEQPAQYVRAVGDPTATPFGGRRYLFSFIRTRTVSMNTRVNWTLKPDLTLQLFAQPFFASGDYRDFREFAAPRTLRTIVYGRDAGTVTQDPATGKYTIDPDGAGAAAPFRLDNPDFTVRSLRGTAVLRYEYRPGSTLFFVWTQQREGSAPYGDFSFRRDYGDLLGDPVDNVFLVKATYWIGR